MIYDELWPEGPRFIKKDDVFQLGTDSVLLSSFVDKSNMKKAIDLGCGSGIISILLAWNHQDTLITGVELQPNAATLALKNVSLNGLEDRINIIEGDLRLYKDFLKAGDYDLVLSNPPYFPTGSGKPSNNAFHATARDERTCTLNDLCAAAAYLTRWGGRFALVHRPERLADVICTLSANGLEPKRLRFVQHSSVHTPNLVLIESRRGGNIGLSVLPPLIMTDVNGNDTDEIKNIYHRR